MNSVCSKNEYSCIAEYFKQNQDLKKVWDYFVFSSINWQPKGMRIKNIINNMQLRDENTLFIDDNISNLNEALYYCPHINVLLSKEIFLIKEQIDKINKDDRSHSRLKQYKILENKNKEKENFSTNEEFLYKSNIVVDIKEDCKNNLERILELINRTNQLNFTKLRITKEELCELLDNPNYDNKYVAVKDRFGDYGIIGFCSVDNINNSLLHFLFSCRTLGMGIEQYVYSKLNYPKLITNGVVVNNVEINKTVDWINNAEILENDEKSAAEEECSILFKGPCDLSSTLPYLNINKENLTLDFASIDDAGLSTGDGLCSENIVASKKYSKDEIAQLLDETPFLSKETFNQKILNKKYDVIVYSLLPDCRSIIYRSKGLNKTFAFNCHLSFTEKENWKHFIKEKPGKYAWDIENLKEYSNKYETLGLMSADKIIENLEFILNNTSKDTKWIFILGSETEFSNPKLSENPLNYIILKKHIQINPALEKYIKSKSNADCINLSKLIKSDKQYTDFIDHFTRETYYQLAENISRKINDLLQTDVSMVSDKKKFIIKNALLFIRRNISSVTKFIFSIGNDRTQYGTKTCKFIIFLGIKIKIKSYV